MNIQYNKSMTSVYIVKRDGTKQPLALEKIQQRIELVCGLKPQYNTMYDRFKLPTKVLNVPCDSFVIRIISKLYDGIETTIIDKLTAIEAYSLAIHNPEYEDLAVRLLVSDLQKNILYKLQHKQNLLFASFDRMYNHVRCETNNTMSDEVMNIIFDNAVENTDVVKEINVPLISQQVYDIVSEHQDYLESIIDYSRDYDITYPGFKLLSKKYLTCDNGEIIELPQHLYMRCALGIYAHKYNGDWENIREDVVTTYNMLSLNLCTHATPTLFNAGRNKPQMSSCYLSDIEADDLDMIYKWNGECAQQSKYAGGIGSSIHKIRARGSYIAGTDGHSNGIVPMLKCIEATSVYVDQGGGKRKGSHAIYLEPWHSDIETFINMKSKNNSTNSQMYAPNLFYAIWINDEFMRVARKEINIYNTQHKRVKLWHLMCPNECKNLYNVYDKTACYSWVTNDDLDDDNNEFEFTKLYRQYITQGKFTSVISAKDLLELIFRVTMETSIPYKCFKDTANRNSNQCNLGTIKHSNLCTEIYEYTDENETAVCNLASICLNKFVKGYTYDYEHLGEVVYQVAKNLNAIIDMSYYPLDKARTSNMKHRPMGIGGQGFANTLAMLGLEAGTDDALELDFHINETIYYYALKASVDLARIEGSYESFQGSPTSQGKLKMDLAMDAYENQIGHVSTNGNISIDDKIHPICYKYMYDWDEMREMVKGGLRNSLRTCCMPTASTSTIKGNSPAMEFFNGTIWKRTDASGEITKYNRLLIEELITLELWNDDLLNEILADDKGSIQNTSLPDFIKRKYKTVWDDNMAKNIIKHAHVRNIFIDQGQSMNLFVANPTITIQTKMLYYAWRHNLNTGCYYLRRMAATSAKKIIISSTSEPAVKVETKPRWVCNDDESCVMCSA